MTPFIGKFGLGPKGFHITFENGWTASVQWGEGNYCNNRRGVMTAECVNAEIAAWDDKKKWYEFPDSGDPNVQGYVKPDDVLAFLNLIAAQ